MSCPVPVPQALPLLKAVAATTGVIPWELSAIESLGSQFLWETRPNVQSAIIIDRAYVVVPMQGVARRFFESLQEYPPSQRPGAFNLEKVQEQIENAARGR